MSEWVVHLMIVLPTGVGLFFLIRWHARTHEYRCPECGHIFTISAMIDFVSPNGFSKKLLKCPKCEARKWCKESRKT